MAGLFILIMPSPSLFHFLRNKAVLKAMLKDGLFCSKWVCDSFTLSLIKMVLHISLHFFSKKGSYGYSGMVMVISG